MSEANCSLLLKLNDENENGWQMNKESSYRHVLETWFRLHSIQHVPNSKGTEGIPIQFCGLYLSTCVYILDAVVYLSVSRALVVVF